MRGGASSPQAQWGIRTPYNLPGFARIRGISLRDHGRRGFPVGTDRASGAQRLPRFSGCHPGLCSSYCFCRTYRGWLWFVEVLPGSRSGEQRSRSSGLRRPEKNRQSPFLNLSKPVHIISTRCTRVLTILCRVTSRADSLSVLQSQSREE